MKDKSQEHMSFRVVELELNCPTESGYSFLRTCLSEEQCATCSVDCWKRGSILAGLPYEATCLLMLAPVLGELCNRRCSRVSSEDVPSLIKKARGLNLPGRCGVVAAFDEVPHAKCRADNRKGEGYPLGRPFEGLS
jgi:hypothetical protein